MLHPDAIPPKTRRHLSFDPLVWQIRLRAKQLPDPRNPADCEYSMADAVMSAFAMFSLKDPSLLAFEKRRYDENIKNLFRVWAAIFHAFWCLNCLWVGPSFFSVEGVDFASAWMFLIHKYGKDDCEFAGAMASVANHAWPVFWYFITIYAAALVCGVLAQRYVVSRVKQEPTIAARWQTLRPT